MTTRSLARLLDPSGLLIGLAFDHRDSLDAILLEKGLAGLLPGRVRALKAAIVQVLAASASAVMLDHDYGASAISGDSIPAGVGLIMPLEAQGYAQLGDERHTTLMADFGAAAARDLGADACKFLVPMRPDRPAPTARQLTVVDRAVATSHRAGLPVVLEPLIYRLSTESSEAFADRSADLTIAATEILANHGADLLKLPFPGQARAADPLRGADMVATCQELDAAANGIPWALYGAGAPIDAFESQLRVAGTAGASGFLVGRSVWRDALVDDPTRDVSAARATALPRFVRLSTIARESCRPVPQPGAGQEGAGPAR